MKPEYEIRSLIKQMELRAANKEKFPNSIGTLDGYAAKFNSPSVDFGGFKEVLLPGCFTRSLAMEDDRHDVRALVGHDKTRILARKSAGTLELREDNVGLAITIHLIDTTEGRDMLKNIEARNLDAMSFGFKPMSAPMWTRDGSTQLRQIAHAHLMEVSIVAWAQYTDTEIEARSLEFQTELLATKTDAPLRLLRQRHVHLQLQ